MKRLLMTAAVLAMSCATSAAQSDGSPYRAYGSWRSLAYQLPGAYRFIDRLDLTEEQQKALDKVYRDWSTERRELMRKALGTLPPLTPEARKDPVRLKAYYARRTELYKAAQIPPPVALVNLILSDEQVQKILEANKVVEAWRKWLSDCMATYDKKLDRLLGPAPEAQPASKMYTYRMFDALTPGGSLLSRLKLSDKQAAALDDLRKQYYAEYREKLAPLNLSLRGAGIPYAHVWAARRSIGSKARAEVKDRYRKLLGKVLTPAQRKLLADASKVLEERDNLIWDRYARYVEEFSAILPALKPADGARR